ncbi:MULTISPECIES: hypothetical protein [unclassified Bradyrhizobium]|nr:MULTISPECIES: hypothetical protein [unclassified Bradyrhizobium]
MLLSPSPVRRWRMLVGPRELPNWCDFCSWGSWQVAVDPLKNRLPGGLAFAGALVRAFRKPRGSSIPFEDIRLDDPEGRRIFLLSNAAGEVGPPITPILSETAGAGAEFNFLNGLIVQPA